MTSLTGLQGSGALCDRVRFVGPTFSGRQTRHLSDGLVFFFFLLGFFRGGSGAPPSFSLALGSHTRPLPFITQTNNPRPQEHGVAPGALLLLERAAAARPRAGADETARSGGRGRGAAANDNDGGEDAEETEDVWAPALAASLCEQVSSCLICLVLFLSSARARLRIAPRFALVPPPPPPPLPRARLGRETHLLYFARQSDGLQNMETPLNYYGF